MNNLKLCVVDLNGTRNITDVYNISIIQNKTLYQKNKSILSLRVYYTYGGYEDILLSNVKKVYLTQTTTGKVIFDYEKGEI